MGHFRGGMGKVARWHMAKVRVGILWYEAVKVKGLIWGWATVWLHVRRRGRSHGVGSVPIFPFYFFCSAIRGGLKR